MNTTMKMLRPASWWGGRWREAIPAGNGQIGAGVYGSVGDETILLSHERLWRFSRTPELPDVSDRLPEVRRLLLEDKPDIAAMVLPDALKDAGYDPQLGEPFPLGDLRISQPANRGFSGYERSLDMETGQVTVSWQDDGSRFTRQLFVSRTDNLVILRLSGSAQVSASFTLDLHDRSDTGKVDTPEFPSGLERVTSGDCIRYAATNYDDSDFGAVARIIPQGGTLVAEGDSISITSADTITVLVSPFVEGDRRRSWNEAQAHLAQIDDGYETLFARHAQEHRRLFTACTVDLDWDGSPAGSTDTDVHNPGNSRRPAPDRANEQLLLEAYQGDTPTELVEKMWAYGRYLLISGSSANGLPVPLQGLWTGEWRAFWGFNMVNENLQMIYWQALQGNMIDLLLPVFDYFDGMMADFKQNAERLYGCRGIYIPAPTAPDSGLLKHLMPHIIHWTGGAGWVAQHYYDYFLYTGDTEFLARRAIPFLRETALFYEDFFTVGDHGDLVSSPSNSPENTPRNHLNRSDLGDTKETAMNATMDFAIAREVLTHLIDGLSVTGDSDNEIDRWKSLLAKVPPYQINDDGAVAEWMHPFYEDNYNHRHESHLYPVFPGTELIEEDDPELFRAFQVAVEKRLVVGLGDQSGWSLAHMANNYARMGDGERALEALEILSRSCLMNNFFTLHNDWRNMGLCLQMPKAPFQIDANMGWTAAVQEMLLYSRPGMIKLLPALPTKWNTGSFRNMLARSQVTVSLEWNIEKGQLQGSFRSAVEQTLTIRFPFPPGSITGLSCSDSDLGPHYRVTALPAQTDVAFSVTLTLEASE